MPKTRQQRRAHARTALRPRRRGGTLFVTMLALMVAGGGAGAFYFSNHRAPITRGAEPGEHWHASYRIYVCGKRMANFPTVEGEIHSHGDGFIHIHPSTPAASGPNASLGTFLRLYETTFTQLKDGRREMIFPTGKTLKDGDRCSDGKRYRWVFTNRGKPVSGDPSAFLPHDGDRLVMQFGPRGELPFPNPYSLVHPEAGVGSPQAPGETPGPDVATTGATPGPASPQAKPTPSPRP